LFLFLHRIQYYDFLSKYHLFLKGVFRFRGANTVTFWYICLQTNCIKPIVLTSNLNSTMEAQKPTIGKFAMNYGLILGLIMVLISVITYVTGMALEGKQWPNLIYYILFPVIIFYSINQFRKLNAGLLTLKEAIKIGLLIGIISAIIYAIYGLIFNYIIDPEFMNQAMEITREKMLEAPNMTEEMVDQQMKWVEKFSNPMLGSAFWIAMSAFFGLLYSLIAGLVMKKEE